MILSSMIKHAMYRYHASISNRRPLWDPLLLFRSANLIACHHLEYIQDRIFGWICVCNLTVGHRSIGAIQRLHLSVPDNLLQVDFVR